MARDFGVWRENQKCWQVTQDYRRRQVMCLFTARFGFVCCDPLWETMGPGHLMHSILVAKRDLQKGIRKKRNDGLNWKTCENTRLVTLMNPPCSSRSEPIVFIGNFGPAWAFERWLNLRSWELQNGFMFRQKGSHWGDNLLTFIFMILEDLMLSRHDSSLQQAWFFFSLVTKLSGWQHVASMSKHKQMEADDEKFGFCVWTLVKFYLERHGKTAAVDAIELGLYPPNPLQPIRFGQGYGLLQKLMQQGVGL